jgi:arabinofuranosyltransferase
VPASRARATRLPIPRSPWDRFVIGISLAAFAVLIWHRRWISDDGLIVLRTVRQLLAGAGPVYNVGERVEANTSTLWTYLLALPGLVPGVSPPAGWSAATGGSCPSGRWWCWRCRRSGTSAPPAWRPG